VKGLIVYYVIAAEPNFYSMNLLMLGKTYMRLKDAEMALTYLTRCINHPVKTPDDKQVNIINININNICHMLWFGLEYPSREDPPMCKFPRGGYCDLYCKHMSHIFSCIFYYIPSYFLLKKFPMEI
jgi:hypothetical protein